MGAICSAPDKGNTPLVEFPDQDTKLKEEILSFEKQLEKNELKGFQINQGLSDCQRFIKELVDEMDALLNDVSFLLTLSQSIIDNNIEATEKHERYSGLLAKINQTIRDVVTQQSDLKQLRSSLNEVKGLMGTDLQHLVTLEKLQIAQNQIRSIAIELNRLEEDYKTEKQLCDNLRDATGDGVELINQFKDILEALREDKAEIKNSFDRQGASIQDLQSMLETMKLSPLFKEPDLFHYIQEQIDEMKELKQSKVQMVQQFIEEIDEKYAMKAQISVKGKQDVSLAAEQLAEVQLLANRREQIKVEYSQLKDDLREAKENTIQKLKLPEVLTKVEQLCGQVFRPHSMKVPLEYASKNLGNALKDGKEAQNVIEQINLAYYLSYPQKIKLVENDRDQVINRIQLSKGVINTKAEELEMDIPDDLVLKEVKKNFQYFSDQFEKFKASISKNVEGHPKSKEEIPDWIKKEEKTKSRLKILSDLQNVFQGLVDTVLGIKKPEVVKQEPKKEEKKKLITEEDDFIPKTNIDSVIDELQQRIAAKLTLQLMDAEKNLYLFGTRKVYAKVINGKLMVRVGGGYMGFEEFYKTYSDAEKVKLLAISPSKEETASTNTSPEGGKKKKKKKKKKVKKVALRYSQAMPDNAPFDEGTTAPFEELDEDDDDEDELNQTIPLTENPLVHNESARELL